MHSAQLARKLLPLIGLLLFCAIPSHATISVIDYSNTTAECVGAGTCAKTITSTTAGNELVVYAYFLTGASITFACNTGVTNNGTGATWQEADHKLGTAFSIYICYAENIASGITVVTVTTSGGTPGATGNITAEISGLATSSTLDQHTNGASSSSSTWSVGPTGTTSTANEYWVSIIAKNNAGDPLVSVGNGFTNRVTSSAAHMNYLDQIVSSTGTITSSGTFTDTPTEGDIVIASFKSAPSVPLGSKIAGPAKMAGPSKTD